MASVRIIGGEWNGRKIVLPAARPYRPTADRVREALFSCLGDMTQLRCLDLFAGSGALGLCAASRGAAQVDFVEQNRAAASALRYITEELGAPARVLAMSAQRFLAQAATAAPADDSAGYDRVFLDPPFADYPTPAAWQRLLARVAPVLRPNARVYCEMPAPHPAPEGWQAVAAKRTGNVHWQILRPSVPARERP